MIKTITDPQSVKKIRRTTPFIKPSTGKVLNYTCKGKDDRALRMKAIHNASIKVVMITALVGKRTKGDD